MHRPTLAVPDLNGNLTRLHHALTHSPPEHHHLILLGDVIDHGPDTPKLLKLIQELHTHHALQYIAGNHEELLINALYGPPGHRHTTSAKPTTTPEWTEWLNNGGDQTLSSYSSKALLHDAEWIRTTAKRWIIRHAWLYSHANRPTPTELRYSEAKAAQDGIDTLLWHRPHLPQDLPRLNPGVIGSVHGHTPKTAPTELTGPDGKPAWFIDLGRTTQHIAIHHSETGIHILGNEQTSTLFPTFVKAEQLLVRLAKTKIG